MREEVSPTIIHHFIYHLNEMIDRISLRSVNIVLSNDKQSVKVSRRFMVKGKRYNRRCIIRVKHSPYSKEPNSLALAVQCGSATFYAPATPERTAKTALNWIRD